jgi:threonine/homoserine/homoserine lactone efflux protein
LVIFIIYGLSANCVRSYVTNSPKIVISMQRLFAATFAALGLKLAMTDQ